MTATLDAMRTMTNRTANSLAARRVLVMGLGRFGGGIGVSRWLVQQGANVTVTDQAPESDLSDSVAALADLPITYRLGGHDDRLLDECDLLVVSPAVDKARAPFFKAARARGIAWTSENNLFLERCPATQIAITGSVGKSTTTAMIGAMLESLSQQADWPFGRVWVGGNIGKSLLSALSEMTPHDVVVLEQSSFQLEDAAAIGRSPHIAVITNFRPNHLDRHGTMESYAAAKRGVFAFQGPGDFAIIPPTSLLSGQHFAAVNGATQVWYEVADNGNLEWSRDGNQRTQPAPVLNVPGRHNRWNAAAALAVIDAMGLPIDAACEAISQFRGLTHRLEFVRDYNGVCYYNDSKATTPDAAMTALESFERPVVMLCGGYDKGVPFDELGRKLAARAKAVVCFGAVRELIFAATRAARGASDTPSVKSVHDFRGGLNLARRLAAPGDVVVLSPACASYDEFQNYEQRGNLFKKIVNDWI